jgi:RNA polymerase sigma factor FliA
MLDKWRDDLANQHLNLVRKIAHKVMSTLPKQTIEIDDLISFGTIGLYESAKRYDPKREFQFSTFAYYRIRGAIYDGLHKSTNWKLFKNRKLQAEESASSYLSHNSTITTPGKTKVDAFKELSEKLQGIATTYMLSIDTTGSEHAMEDSNSISPEKEYEKSELFEKVKNASESLTKQEQAIVRGFYFEGKSLAELANEFGYSRSWSSRIHYRAIEKLKKSILYPIQKHKIS